MFEITFAMIKPDITQSKSSGKIITMIEENGFEILTLQQGVLSKELAERFYAMHKDQPFFQELIEFITSGPVITMALAKENAIAQWRNLMGETDPAKDREEFVKRLQHTFDYCRRINERDFKMAVISNDSVVMKKYSDNALIWEDAKNKVISQYDLAPDEASKRVVVGSVTTQGLPA